MVKYTLKIEKIKTALSLRQDIYWYTWNGLKIKKSKSELDCIKNLCYYYGSKKNWFCIKNEKFSLYTII